MDSHPKPIPQELLDQAKEMECTIKWDDREEGGGYVVAGDGYYIFPAMPDFAGVAEVLRCFAKEYYFGVPAEKAFADFGAKEGAKA